MKTIEAIEEAISELGALSEKEMNTFEYDRNLTEYNRLRSIIQELENVKIFIEHAFRGVK